MDRDPRFLNYDLRADPGTPDSPYKDEYDRFNQLVPKLKHGHPDSPFAEDGTLKSVEYAIDPVNGVYPMVQSLIDLVDRYNRRGSRKFERMGADGGSLDPTLNPMARQKDETAKQYADRLRRYAAEAEREAGGQAKEVEPVDSEPDDVKTLRELTFDELKGFAAASGVDVGDDDTKESLIGKCVAATFAGRE